MKDATTITEDVSLLITCNEKQRKLIAQMTLELLHEKEQNNLRKKTETRAMDKLQAGLDSGNTKELGRAVLAAKKMLGDLP